MVLASLASKNLPSPSKTSITTQSQDHRDTILSSASKNSYNKSTTRNHQPSVIYNDQTSLPKKSSSTLQDENRPFKFNLPAPEGLSPKKTSPGRNSPK